MSSEFSPASEAILKKTEKFPGALIIFAADDGAQASAPLLVLLTVGMFRERNTTETTC